MSIAPPTAADKAAEVVYPDSDGEPLAETFIHVQAIILLFQALQDWLAGRPDFYVAADMFWYWEEGNPRACRAPDMMVIAGVGQAERRSFFTWREHSAVPCVIVEVTSEKTWREDYFEKRRLYARLGVREYFLFDPEAACLRPALQGFRRGEQGAYVSLDPDEQDCLRSEELGVYLRAEGQAIRLLDGTTREPVLSRKERADAEKQRADTEKQRADAEKQRAEGLEAEVARLRALLQQQAGQGGGRQE